MARLPSDQPETEGNGQKPRIALPDGKEVSVKRARALMVELTNEAADLKADESSAAKTRRVEIGRELRKIQNALDSLLDIVEVIIPPDASKQFPFIIGQREFWPGAHMCRSDVAQTLRYMMDQHRAVEGHRVVSGGNAQGDSLGKELPSL